MGTDHALFDAETWERALERYGAVTRLTAWVYDSDHRLVCGPRPSSPLFHHFETHGFEPEILADSVRQILTPSPARPDVMIARSFGLAVVGTPLRLDGRIVGAAVAGYALVDFCQASAIESLAHHAHLPFRPLWQIATQVQPLPEQRLTMHAQLLSLLGDTILTAHDRTRQVEEMVGQLEQRVEERTVELATANRSLAAEVGERAAAEERVRKLLSRLIVVREEERHRIARNIHDHMGQQLTALKLRLEVMERLAPGSTGWREQLGHTQDLVGRLDADVETLTGDLRPLFVETLGVVRALAKLVEEWRQTAGVAARFENRAGELAWLDADAHLNLFRIAQEALHNVAKHAKATGVDIGLERRDDRLILTVADNGQGFEPAAGGSSPSGMGLIGMHERAALMQGSLTVESAVDHGTVIRVAVPVGLRGSAPDTR
jgi:signal transduction histidine kinase